MLYDLHCPDSRASVLVILAVLVQNPKSGMAANFGASNQVMGVRETTNFLEKFTWTMAIAIVVLSLVATLAMDRTSSPRAIRRFRRTPRRCRSNCSTPRPLPRCRRPRFRPSSPHSLPRLPPSNPATGGNNLFVPRGFTPRGISVYTSPGFPPFPVSSARFSSAWLSDAFSGLSALCRFPSFWGLAFAPPAPVFLPHPCPVPVVSGLGET